jgi:phosphatidate cytidylyltransferase
VKSFFIRTLSGLSYALLVIGSILWGPFAFAFLMFGFLMLALKEYKPLIDKTGTDVSNAGLYLSAGATYLLGIAYILEFLPLSYLSLLFPIVIFSFIIELFRKKENPFGNIAGIFLSLFFIAIPLVLMNLLFYPDLNLSLPKVDLLLGFFLLIWLNDTFAYLTGSLIGKHLLFKRLSPKKTWEGIIGGGIFSLGGAWLLSYFYPSINQIEWIGFVLVIIIFGTFGDLIESMFKRSINVKDSGNIMPGHGGLLDRLDSLLISAPVLFAYLIFVLN